MLVLSYLLLIWCIISQETASANLTYFVKENDNNLFPICVAHGREKYEGISWIYEIKPDMSNGLPEINARYLPQIENKYNCKFSSNLGCTQYWSMMDWFIDDNSTKRFDLITDERWEDLPTIFLSENSEPFKERIKIPQVFKLAFSLRKLGNDKSVEIYVCEGADPKTFPCYRFQIKSREIILSRHQTYDLLNKPDKDVVIGTYQAFSNILNHKEWKNFVVEKDEQNRILLWDANQNRTLIDKIDQNPLKVTHFTYKSNTLSLWKIHQNEFFYTKSSQISRLGPRLNLSSKDVCITLLVSLCKNCQMVFFYMENKAKIYLQQEELREFESWNLIRLYKKNVVSSAINIFAQTFYADKRKAQNGFWAIDNVRVCHKDEIRISEITNGFNDEVSCQFITKPNLPPKKIEQKEISDFPQIKKDSDSKTIKLAWKDENLKELEYYISYQANDICRDDEEFNGKRLRSNGFLVTKKNSITLTNLIPYTVYNITIETVLHKRKQLTVMNTKENKDISYEELPKKINYLVTDKSANITWNRVTCDNIYGHIFYELRLKEKLGSNITVFPEQIENTKLITGLKPFTNYSLDVATFRNKQSKQNIWQNAINVEFQTKPGLAGPAKNLEIYATSNETLSLRFDLPENNPGEVYEVHISRCHSLSLRKCKSKILAALECSAFPGKYCVDVTNLIPNQTQYIKLSLKNKGSHTFGPESTIEGFNMEKIPAPPMNLTYEVYDCGNTEEFCSLEIEWIHPYNQNGSLTAFNIFLNGTTLNKLDNQNEDVIRHVYKLNNRNYLPKYNYKMKYKPYGKVYQLSLQSVNNDLKSNFVSTIIEPPEIIQNPRLIKTTHNSFIFEIPPKDPGLNTDIKVFIQDSNKNQIIDYDYLKNNDFNKKNLCYNYGKIWISQTIQTQSKAYNITIGESDISKEILKPNTTYCVIFLMVNQYLKSVNNNIYSITSTTLPTSLTNETPKTNEEKTTSYLGLIIVISVILIILLILTIYCILKNRKHQSTRKSVVKMKELENAYETLPFDDAEYTTITNNRTNGYS